MTVERRLPCDNHEFYSKRISEVEACDKVLCERTTTHTEQIDDLYNKYNAMNVQHATVIEKLNGISSTQQTTLARVSELCQQFFEHKKREEEKYDQIDNSIRELNEFNWFRHRMNSIRDNLPMIVVYIIVATLIILVIASEMTFGDWFKRLFNLGK